MYYLSPFLIFCQLLTVYYCSQHSFKCFPCINRLKSYDNPVTIALLSQFNRQEAEAQKGKVTLKHIQVRSDEAEIGIQAVWH